MTRVDRAAARTVHRAINPATCARCRRPIRGASTLALRVVEHGIARVEVHERCPARLTSRGQLAADVAFAAVVGLVCLAAIWVAWAVWATP
jgi:hypothetical protein